MKQTDRAPRSALRARSHPGAELRGMLAAALLASAGLLLGCSEPEAPLLRQRGLAPGEEVPRGPTPPPPSAPPPAPPPPRSSLESPFAARAPDPGALVRREPARDEDAGMPAAPQRASGPADTGAQRDLPAELTALLGQPASCLELASVASAGGRVTISLVAYAVPSGRITRATATAPGQPATALRCLEQRAMAVSLRGPVPGAPLQVTATIPIEVISQPTPR
jgi:hypothetical protein